MSQETAERARGMIDAWNRRDRRSLVRTAAPEIEYVNSPLAVEPGTRRGRDQYAAVLDAQWEVVGDARLQIESLRMSGDDAFVMARMSRTLEGSATPVEARIGMGLTYRDGRLARQELIPAEDFPQALEAAGLS